jgi:hypothetical protein
MDKEARKPWGRILGFGVPAAAGVGAAGAAAGAASEKRKRFTVASIDTPKGRFHAVGQRKHIKGLSRAIKDRNVGDLVRASQRVLFLPKKKQKTASEEDTYIPETSIAEDVEVGKEEKDEKKKKAALEYAIAKLSLMKKEAGKGKAVAKGLALVGAGGAAGAAATYGATKGREFGVMRSPVGYLAGRKRDLKGMVEAAKDKDVEEFKEKARRTVPIHPVYSHAFERKRMQKKSALDAKAPELEKEAKGAILNFFRRLIGKAPRSAAKGVAPKMGVSGAPKGGAWGVRKPPKAVEMMAEKTPIVSSTAAAGKAATKAAPEATKATTKAVTEATTEQAKKPFLSKWMKRGLLVGVPATYLAGKGIGAAKDITVAGMNQPSYLSPTQARQFS